VAEGCAAIALEVAEMLAMKREPDDLNDENVIDLKDRLRR
jgi:hypothetical protein